MATQDVFTLTSDALPPGTRVLTLEGVEGLSTPYAFELQLLVPADDAVDEAAALGADASIDVNRDDGSSRTTTHGIVAAIELLGDLQWHALYRVVVVPRLWRLSLSHHSRVWVDRTVPQILEDVLKRAGLTGADYVLRLTGSYAAREHVCQYHESDLDFLSRWMEREGIFYFFEQGDAKEKLVLADDKSAHKPMVTEPIRFVPAGGGETGVEGLHAFSHRHGARPTAVGLKDYDYLKPLLDVSGKAPAAQAGSAVVTVYGENLADPGEAKRIAKVRSQELMAAQALHSGVGRVFDLRPGYTFELDEHPQLALNRPYLTVELRHHGRQLDGAEGVRTALEIEGEEDRTYLVEVTALDAKVPFRPARRTPTPRVPGLESAVVDGPETSEYSQLDEHGRYLVRIGFDESGLKDGKASTRVRMLQPHGGSPEGWHLPLRKGTEVLLAFLGGDPDRPVIVTVGPNADTPSLVATDNHTHNVLQTGGLSRYDIEDQDGAQYVDTSTPPENTFVHLGAHHDAHTHNFVISTDGDKHMHTGGNRDITVGGDQTEDVTGDLTEDYHANQTTHVFAAHKETIDGDATQTIHAGSKQTIDGGLTQQIDSGDERTVTGGLTESIVGGRTQSIDGSSTESITGSLTQSIAGGATITTPAAYTIETGGNFTAIAPAGITIVAAGGQKYTAPSGHTNIDSFLSKLGGTVYDTWGQALSVSGLKGDVIGLTIGLVGTSLSFGVMPIEFTGSFFENDVTKLQTRGAALKQAALNMVIVGLFLRT